MRTSKYFFSHFTTIIIITKIITTTTAIYIITTSLLQIQPHNHYPVIITITRKALFLTSAINFRLEGHLFT